MMFVDTSAIVAVLQTIVVVLTTAFLLAWVLHPEPVGAAIMHRDCLEPVSTGSAHAADVDDGLRECASTTMLMIVPGILAAVAFAPAVPGVISPGTAMLLYAGVFVVPANLLLSLSTTSRLYAALSTIHALCLLFGGVIPGITSVTSIMG